MDRHTLTARNLRRIAKWEKEATLTLEAKRHHDAAPDLLAALLIAVQYSESNMKQFDLEPAAFPWLDRARAAIAKATGRE